MLENVHTYRGSSGRAIGSTINRSLTLVRSQALMPMPSVANADQLEYLSTTSLGKAITQEIPSMSVQKSEVLPLKQQFDPPNRMYLHIHMQARII